MLEVRPIRPSLAMSIRDSILLGAVDELDALLRAIELEAEFPADLKSGLEALRHFRATYGVGRAIEPQDPVQKKQMTLMETAWGAELLEMLKRYEDKPPTKRTSSI